MNQVSKPNARVYVHRDCGEATEVSGRDFRRACNPFDQIAGTFCCHCNTMVALSSVSWADTGETLVDYRRRLRKQSPLLLKAWIYGIGLLVGAVFGGGITWLLCILNGLPAARAQGGAIAGAVLGGLLIYITGGFVLMAVYRLDYRSVR